MTTNLTLEQKIKIESALSKLTESEIELLGYKYFKITPEERGYYNLTIGYMDYDDMDHFYVKKISLGNPFLEFAVKAIEGEIEGFDSDLFSYNWKKATVDKFIKLAGLENNEQNASYALEFSNILYEANYEGNQFTYITID